MTLAEIIKDYLKKRGMTVKGFADMCGINQETFFVYFRGGKVSPHVARKIEAATKGELSIEIFRPFFREFKGRQPKKPS